MNQRIEREVHRKTSEIQKENSNNEIESILEKLVSKDEFYQ